MTNEIQPFNYGEVEPETAEKLKRHAATIKSIQSKKTLTRWLTTEEGNNDEFRNACRIEKMLLEHKAKIKPVDETTIRKTDLETVIETIESSGELSTARIVEMLKGLL